MGDRTWRGDSNHSTRAGRPEPAESARRGRWGTASVRRTRTRGKRGRPGARNPPGSAERAQRRPWADKLTPGVTPWAQRPASRMSSGLPTSSYSATKTGGARLSLRLRASEQNPLSGDVHRRVSRRVRPGRGNSVGGLLRAGRGAWCYRLADWQVGRGSPARTRCFLARIKRPRCPLFWASA